MAFPSLVAADQDDGDELFERGLSTPKNRAEGGNKTVKNSGPVRGKLMTLLFAALLLYVPAIHAVEAQTKDKDAVEAERTSNSGGPVEAVRLTGDSGKGSFIFKAKCIGCHNMEGRGGVPNPGSEARTVPALNPISRKIYNKDYRTFVENIDLYMQHGSTPEGPNPARKMPAFGDDKLLTQQEIADVTAYVSGLNKESR